MNTSWTTLNPQWYSSERTLVSQNYPKFQVDEGLLSKGTLCYYGELLVRPSGGTKRHPVRFQYPNATPFELPVIVPVESLPEFDDAGQVKEHPKSKYFDRRHQMPDGALCLFQRETRGAQGGELIGAPDVLRRAERWFLGLHTGHWPPDSGEAELEPHFLYAGDVLLSKTFYSPDINGGGEFFMVRDMHRIFDGVSREDPPLIVTALTQTTGAVQLIFDAREDLQNIYPWIHDDAWSPAKLVDREAKQKPDETWNCISEHGYWWALPKEPQPFRNGAGLLHELESVAPNGDAWRMLSDALGTELTTYSEHFFALRYPGRSSEFEWLILYMPKQVSTTAGGGILYASNDTRKRTVFENAPLGCYCAHSVQLHNIQLRNKSVVQTIVHEKTVALIGLGALGAKVAELLAQAGVGKFRLCDSDRLAIGNVARHIGGLSDCGAWKPRVVSTRIFDINPYVSVTAVRNESAVSFPDKLADFMEPADLTISTTADENVESAINQIAVLRNKTVLYGRALRRASMGRVFLVKPRTDPCKACLGNFARAFRSGEHVPEDWLEISEREQDILLHECGRPVIPASATDLAFIAAIISRIALSLLEGREASANHWLWVSEPAVDIDPRLDSPLSTLSLKLSRWGECPVCQEPDVSSVLLSEKARDAILTEVQSSVSTETGGILLGHVGDDRAAVVLQATGPGPKAAKSPVGFDRDVTFVQAELEKAAQEFGPQCLYLGEWHSHLDADPEPSVCDIASMCGIAQAPNYATRCPVLLIAGLDNKSGQVATLKTWCFPLTGRIHSIPNDEIR